MTSPLLKWKVLHEKCHTKTCLEVYHNTRLIFNAWVFLCDSNTLLSINKSHSKSSNNTAQRPWGSSFQKRDGQVTDTDFRIWICCPSGWILAVNFRGWKQQFISGQFRVLIKGIPPTYWPTFSPDLYWSQGGQNPWKIGGNPPIGGKESTLSMKCTAIPKEGRVGTPLTPLLARQNKRSLGRF